MRMAKCGKYAALAEEALPYGRSDDVRLDRLDGYKLRELAIGTPRKIHDPRTSVTEDAHRLKESELRKLGVVL
jgi:hypothetical protein